MGLKRKRLFKNFKFKDIVKDFWKKAHYKWNNETNGHHDYMTEGQQLYWLKKSYCLYDHTY